MSVMAAQERSDQLARVDLLARDAELIDIAQALATGPRVAAAIDEIAGDLRPVGTAGVARDMHRGAVMSGIRQVTLGRHGWALVDAGPEAQGGHEGRRVLIHAPDDLEH